MFELYDWELEALKKIIAIYHRHPFYGYRKIALELKDEGISEKQVRRIMKKNGIQAIFPGINLSKPRNNNNFLYQQTITNQTITSIYFILFCTVNWFIVIHFI